MCEFFSAIVHQDGRILFTELDSHEEIIRRAGLKDDTLLRRSWVRVETRPTTDGFGPVRVDEVGTLPAWWTEHAEELGERVTASAMRVATAREAYQKATATAWEAYQKAEATAWEAYQKAPQEIPGYCGATP